MKELNIPAKVLEKWKMNAWKCLQKKARKVVEKENSNIIKMPLKMPKM